MHEDTSIRAYYTIKENGLLSKRRFQVYDIVYNHGPITANEMIRIARKSNPDINQTGIQPRLSELENLGVVFSCGEKKDERSGHYGKLWQITGSLPIKRKTLLLDKLEKQIRLAEERVVYLKMKRNDIIKGKYCEGRRL